MATVSSRATSCRLFTSTMEDYDVHFNDYEWMSQRTTPPRSTSPRWGIDRRMRTVMGLHA
jgi:hypothetical protein